jgi:hypothetical protein
MFAAMTRPVLTCQVLDGRFRSPMALAVRTPLVSTTACSRWTMYWAWWLPGKPAIPLSGMLVQGDSYRLKDRDLGRVPAATMQPA